MGASTATGAVPSARALARSLAPDGLRKRLRELVRHERATQVDFLLHLAEFDARRAFIEAGHSSLWNYCLRELHLREGPAARRIGAMRAMCRHPGLEAPLRDGRLCLSTVSLIAPLLRDMPLDEVVARAAYRTKAEVEQFVVSVRPRTVPRDGVRQLPQREPSSAAGNGDSMPEALSPGRDTPPGAGADPTPRASGWLGGAAVPPAAAAAPAVGSFPLVPQGPATPARAGLMALPAMPGAAQQAALPTPPGDRPALISDPPRVDVPTAVAVVIPEPPRVAVENRQSRAELMPVSATHWSLRVKLDASMKADLDTLQSLLSHTSGHDLAEVIREALRCAVEKHGKRRGAVAPARRAPDGANAGLAGKECASHRGSARDGGTAAPGSTVDVRQADTAVVALRPAGEKPKLGGRPGGNPSEKLGDPGEELGGKPGEELGDPGAELRGKLGNKLKLGDKPGEKLGGKQSEKLGGEPGEKAGEMADEKAGAKVGRQGGRNVNPRAISAETRRAVWARDQNCCAWVNADGTRCGSRWRLEVDHITPVARGGTSNLDNLRLACRSHNWTYAERIFGREHMAKFRRQSPTPGSVLPIAAPGPGSVLPVAAPEDVVAGRAAPTGRAGSSDAKGNGGRGEVHDHEASATSANSMAGASSTTGGPMTAQTAKQG